ncbi:hypothetical protein CANINC_000908 [Pichia inconspicua]|uniref:Ribosomal RNA-processing protein 42 n=1 Tax=Pichia inconspicua TaxID=52247 RepID=A0A4T0X5J0_9ASCO|nr:hypothetical protein CANINC_000908 [[Candida] inconspicua]
MVLSVAESSYIYDSLFGTGPTRPDARNTSQYRPLKAICGFLPNSNGSSRIYNADGIECITSVKAKVVRTNKITELINIDVDIFGERDNTILVQQFTTLLKDSLTDSFDYNVLKLTGKYYFQLYIDISILYLPEDFSNSSYTLYSVLSLISMGVYLALKSTKLPLLLSEKDDFDVEEEPTFSDDWEASTYLIPRSHERSFQPALIFIVGVAGDTVIIDPSLEEEQILEHGICITWSNFQIGAPIQSLILSNANTKGLKPALLLKATQLVESVANDVLSALNGIAERDVNEFDDVF